jgi:hypothetical protein
VSKSLLKFESTFKVVTAVLIFLGTASFSDGAVAQEIIAKKVSIDVSKLPIPADAWKDAPEAPVNMMAQPMALPRPKATATDKVKVQVIHDGKWIAFRLKWADTEVSNTGKLGQFSDAAAIQFPVKDGPPPPIFMGVKGSPVHIFHWRYQYQMDHDHGKPEMKEIYPNMNPDMYPMEFKDSGKLVLNDQMRETYSPGKAAGNPQSYVKGRGIDEIFAEGFGSSAVIENVMSQAHGEWDKNEWTLVIIRPMKLEQGSILKLGKDNYAAFAIWQGGKDEVGSRKAVTMSWTTLNILEK